MSLTSTARPVTPVGILAELLHDLETQLGVEPGASPQVLAGIARAAALARGLDPYLTGCTTPESAALQELARRTRAVDWSAHRGAAAPLEQEMLSGHVEGQLLKLLVHATAARRVLEIGMFTGYSALAMAEALPADGTLQACELDPYAAGIARECFDASPHGAKIIIHLGPAQQTLQRLAAQGERFDLVFVDADKAGYRNYLDQVLDADLLSPRGLLAVDNTLMQGEAYLAGRRSDNGAAIAAFNAYVAAEPRVEQVLLPLRDGLTLIRRVG